MTKNRRHKLKIRAAMSELATNYTRARRTIANPPMTPTGPGEPPDGPCYLDTDDFEPLTLACPADTAPVTALIGLCGSGAGLLRDKIVDDFLLAHEDARVIAFDPKQVAGDGLICPRWADDPRVSIWDTWLRADERIHRFIVDLQAATYDLRPTLVSLSHLWAQWPSAPEPDGAPSDFFADHRGALDAAIASLVRAARSTQTQVLIREERFRLPDLVENACTTRVLLSPRRGGHEHAAARTWPAMFPQSPLGEVCPDPGLPDCCGWVSVAGAAPRPAVLFHRDDAVRIVTPRPVVD